jgi:hypothetical protein
MAIGGELLSDQKSPRDIMTVNIAVMDAARPAEVRERVISGVLARLAGYGAVRLIHPAPFIRSPHRRGRAGMAAP